MSNKEDSNFKSEIMLRDIVMVFLFAISIGGVVAYAHTQFAYRDDVQDIRQKVYDLWVNQGLDKRKRN